MGTQKRRSLTPITDILYPRKRQIDNVSPADRLAEHRRSVAPVERTFRITGTSKARLGRLASSPKRRGGRGRKPVSA